MKTCSKCKLSKEETEFSFVNKEKSIRNTQCSECRKTYFKNWRSNHLNRHIQMVKERRDENRKWIIAYKEANPCKDCGNSFPFYVMDFDHSPDQEKKFGIAQVGALKGRETLLAEIAKCDLVCSNCHRIRTWKRKDRFKNNLQNGGSNR